MEKRAVKRSGSPEGNCATVCLPYQSQIALSDRRGRYYGPRRGSEYGKIKIKFLKIKNGGNKYVSLFFSLNFYKNLKNDIKYLTIF